MNATNGLCARLFTGWLSATLFASLPADCFSQGVATDERPKAGVAIPQKLDFDDFEQNVIFLSPWRTKDVSAIRTGLERMRAQCRPNGTNEWQENWLKAWSREVDLVAALDEPSRLRLISNVLQMREIVAQGKDPSAEGKDPAATLTEVDSLFNELAKVLDERCPSYLIALEIRAHFHKWNDDHSEAMADYSRLAKLRSALIGSNNPLYASDRESMGSAAGSLKRYPEAEECYSECLRLRSQWLSPDSYLIAACECNLGINDVRQKRYEKAIERFGRVIAKNQRANMQESVLDGSAYHHLGIAYGQTGKLLEAEACFGQAKSNYRRTASKTHPMRLVLLEDELSFYETTSQPEKAKAARAEIEALKIETKSTAKREKRAP